MPFDPAFATKVFASLRGDVRDHEPDRQCVRVPLADRGASPESQRKVAVAVTAAVATAVGCVGAVVAGGLILRVFGISVDDFRLAGGVLVFLIALSMIQGAASHAHAATPKEKAETDEAAPDDVAIYPLTVPLLVGPGTIATLIVFGETARHEGKILELAVGLGAFLALLAASLLGAPFIGRHFSQKATAITRRLMGMILAAVAIEMIVTSLRHLFPGLAGAAG